MTASDQRHIQELSERLAEAEATIAALVSGQVDAVIEGSNWTPILLAKAQDALRASEEQYRYIVETTNDGIWVIDAQHQTRFMNRRMAQMLGCEVDMGLGRSPFDFVDDAGRAALTSHIDGPSASQTEIRYVRTDGTSVWTLVDGTPMFDDHGRYSGSLAVG